MMLVLVSLTADTTLTVDAPHRKNINFMMINDGKFTLPSICNYLIHGRDD